MKINELNISQDVTDNDLIPIYDVSAGATRAVTVKSLADLIVSDMDAPPGVVVSYFLDVQSQSASLVALPTSATTFIATTIASEIGGASYNATTGTLTIPFTGIYTLTFSFNTVIPSGTHSVFTGAKLWNGSSFVPLRYSARVVSVRINETGQAIFTSTNRFTAGTKLQLDGWCDSGVNIQSITPVGGSTNYTVPAARILLSGVETQ